MTSILLSCRLRPDVRGFLNQFLKGDRPHPPVGSRMAEIGSKTVDVFSWFMNRQTSGWFHVADRPSRLSDFSHRQPQSQAAIDRGGHLRLSGFAFAGGDSTSSPAMSAWCSAASFAHGIPEPRTDVVRCTPHRCLRAVNVIRSQRHRARSRTITQTEEGGSQWVFSQKNERSSSAATTARAFWNRPWTRRKRRTESSPRSRRQGSISRPPVRGTGSRTRNGGNPHHR
jgi:hypothetical protein